MKNQKVLSYRNLPTKLPIEWTILAYLLCDKFNVSQLTWGIVGTLLVLLWIGSIYAKLHEDSIEMWSK